MSEKEKTIIEMAQEFAKEQGLVPGERVELEARSPEDTLKTPMPLEPQPIRKSAEPLAAGADGTMKETLEKLLEKTKGKTGWIEIKLPSRGKAYVAAPEMVRIRPFRFEEEKALRSVRSEGDGMKVIAQMLSNCIEGINYQDLTLSDKNFLLFHIRRLSYGDVYKITSDCNNCGEKNNLTLKISEIPVNYASDDYTEPFTLVLPDSEQEVMYVSPRVTHEMQFASMNGIMENLHSVIVSIGDVRDEFVIQEFLKHTTVRDVSTLVRAVFDSPFGLDQRINYTCASCKKPVIGEVDLNQDFFSPS